MNIIPINKAVVNVYVFKVKIKVEIRLIKTIIVTVIDI